MRGLAILVAPLLLVVANASASHGMPPPDGLLPPGTEVSGLVIHDPLGMCHFGPGCPWPWMVAGNHVGACTPASGPGWWFMSCDGLWRELYFDFQVRPGGAQATIQGLRLAVLDQGDSLALYGMAGTVAVFCTTPSGPGYECVTNFTGRVAAGEYWIDYWPA